MEDFTEENKINTGSSKGLGTHNDSPVKNTGKSLVVRRYNETSKTIYVNRGWGSLDESSKAFVNCFDWVWCQTFVNIAVVLLHSLLFVHCWPMLVKQAKHQKTRVRTFIRCAHKTQTNSSKTKTSRAENSRCTLSTWEAQNSVHKHFSAQ